MKTSIYSPKNSFYQVVAKRLAFVCSLLLCLFLQAQTPYQDAMKSKIETLTKAQTTQDYMLLEDGFRRIATKEASNWLPYYYLAYTQYLLAEKSAGQISTQQVDEILDRMQESLSFSDKFVAQNQPDSNQNRSEIGVLHYLLHSLRMRQNPQERYMSEVPKLEQYLSMAQQLEPSNPRVSLQYALKFYFTPKQFGGSQEKAKEYLEKAKELFAKFQPTSDISPNWGERINDYFLQKTK